MHMIGGKVEPAFVVCLLTVCLCPGGAGGKGVWGAAGMVYEDEEPDARDPNYDESAQVSSCRRLVSVGTLGRFVEINWGDDRK